MISKIGATTNSLAFGKKVTLSEKPKEPRTFTFDTKQITFGIDEDGIVRIIDLSKDPYKAYLVPGLSARQMSDLYNSSDEADERIMCDSIEETVV